MSFLALVALSGPSQADDEKAAKQLEKLDSQFVKALTELAKSYDDKKIPEAAHFFASCAIGFGGKDENLPLIKGGWEGAVYLGKLRGGDPIKETAPITAALGNLSTAYKKGRAALVSGHLAQDRWDDKETGQKRSKLRVVGQTVQFIGGGSQDDASSDELPATDEAPADPAPAPVPPKGTAAKPPAKPRR
jgi:hypothetical protein